MNTPVRATVTVPVLELFNISAYRPGDFKQFFQDPRTRGEYLKWAPMLLTAEEYHAKHADELKRQRDHEIAESNNSSSDVEYSHEKVKQMVANLTRKAEEL